MLNVKISGAVYGGNDSQSNSARLQTVIAGSSRDTQKLEPSQTGSHDRQFSKVSSNLKNSEKETDRLEQVYVLQDEDANWDPFLQYAPSPETKTEVGELMRLPTEDVRQDTAVAP